MAELVLLSELFRRHASASREAFLEHYPGAFFLVRQKQGGAPSAVFLGGQEGFKLTLGSDEDCDLPFETDQTLDAVHAIVCYHPGFKGWTIEDAGSSFGTLVGNERLAPNRAVLLLDQQVIRPGGGLVELQLYQAGTLWDRMTRAGVTNRIRKPIPRRPAPPSGDDDDDGDEALD